MKKIRAIIILFIGLSMLLPVGCQDFLEQPEGSIITVDSVFNSPDNAMKALFNVYATNVVDGFISGDGGSGLSDAGIFDGLLLAASDEGTQGSGGARSRAFRMGTWGPNNQDEYSIGRVMQGMRNACIFLENVDKVPFVSTGQYNWTEELKNQTIAEAKVLRALSHFEMMKRFGGIPIMDQVPRVVIQKIDGVNKAVTVPSAYRQSLRSTIDFIVSSCDESIPFLPNSYTEAESGRVTRGVALALKARTLLYAASPLYNTSTPYLPGEIPDSLICLGSYDETLWQRAVSSNKDVLDWAEANGYTLLDDPTLDSPNNFYSGSYNYATGAVRNPRNREVIHFNNSHGHRHPGSNLVRWTCPIYYSWGNTVHAIPMNFVRQYRNMKGENVEIPSDGTFPELKQIMKDMESRFHATAWWPGSQYTYSGLLNNQGGADTTKFLYRREGVGGQFVMTGAGPQLIGLGIPDGFHMKKFINHVSADPGSAGIDAYWPIFRLAEFYLNYAEALNEQDPSNSAIIDALNVVRKRGKIPLLEPGNSVYDEFFGNQQLMRDYIRRERAIELYGEEHRFFDVRRWMIAPEVMQGTFYRIFLYENGTGRYLAPLPMWSDAQRAANDRKLSYKIEPFEERVWEDKMYFYPFPQNEVNKGFLIQNPGW